MSQSVYNQIVALTANTVATIDVPVYFDRVIVTNQSATSEVYVSTNGTPVTQAEGGFGGTVLPGVWRMIGNDQSKEPLVTQAPGSTAQGSLNATEGGASHTVVSLLGTASGTVVLEFV